MFVDILIIILVVFLIIYTIVYIFVIEFNFNENYNSHGQYFAMFIKKIFSKKCFMNYNKLVKEFFIEFYKELGNSDKYIN